MQTESVALVRMDDDFTRRTDEKYYPGGSTVFADGYPLLICVEESLRALNERMPDTKKKLKMENFRPNIVLAGAQAFDEDLWSSASIVHSDNESLCLSVVKPCSRCTIPAVDPDTGSMDKDNTVTRVLKLFRQGKQLVFSSSLKHVGRWGGEVFFGMNAVPLIASGDSVSICVGQKVVIAV